MWLDEMFGGPKGARIPLSYRIQCENRLAIVAMRYDLDRLPFQDLMAPVATATAAIARLDERLLRSREARGWISRSHFSDTCASLWVDGELVHPEDLILHDADMGARRPTHELSIARDILRTRRRILSHPADWAVSSDGLRRLRKGGDENAELSLEVKSFSRQAGNEAPADEDDQLAAELAAIDNVLARSEALLLEARKTVSGRADDERAPLVYEPDWDEDERLAAWLQVLKQSEGLPTALRAAVLLDGWNVLQVLQHGPWLGRLLTASILRRDGLSSGYLLPISVGLKQMPRQKRGHRARDVRLAVLIDAMTNAAEFGLKEHDRLSLARQQMEHRLIGRRGSSRLPQLVDLVLEKPFVSMAMIVDALSVTPQGALKMVGELGLRELTGRGRFRAWGIL